MPRVRPAPKSAKPAKSTTATDPITLAAVGAGRFLGISRAHWLRLVASGRAPSGVKLGTRRLWARSELTCWFEAGCPSAARWEERKR